VPSIHSPSKSPNLSLIQATFDHLVHRGETLSVAESVTGGALGSAITSVPGASLVFLGGAITYSNEVKTKVLGVDADLIRSHGVVSEEVAHAMAEGARRVYGSTWAIATTGVAGPGPAEGIAPGTVWIAISGPINHTALLAIEGDREIVRNATVTSAVVAFERILSTRK
jgi:nicotinamide-nucleotide amidase